MIKLFFGGFPLTYDEMDIVRLVAPHGNVSTIKIVRDRKTKKCKGYAFLEMVTQEDARKTVDALNGSELDGRPLTLNINTEPAAVNPPVYKRVSHSAVHQKSKRPRISR